MANDISKFDDVIDSRDVIARIEELREERDDLQAAIDDAQAELEAASPTEYDDSDEAYELEKAQAALEEWSGAEELAILEALADEASGYAADWHHGETLIRYSYFKEYAMELADDIGALSGDAQRWPLTCIDWDQAAEELKMDYTAVDFDGVEYFIR